MLMTKGNAVVDVHPAKIKEMESKGYIPKVDSKPAPVKRETKPAKTEGK